MKKSVLSAAMLLAVGVSGAANAVQMHGVVKGTLTGSASYDNLPLNNGMKTWGSNSAPQNEQTIQVDFWFDSAAINSYNLSKATHLYDNTSVPNQFMNLAVTYNGVTRNISSALNWTLYDGDYVSSKILNIDVTESGALHDQRLARLESLSFADKNHPVLREAMLGHVVNTVEVKDLGTSSYFTYQGTVNGKAYDSRLVFNANSFALAPVPEPETWAMMLLGLGVVGYAARRRAAR